MLLGPHCAQKLAFGSPRPRSLIAIAMHIQEAPESKLIKEGLKCLKLKVSISIKTLTNEDGT